MAQCSDRFVSVASLTAAIVLLISAAPLRADIVFSNITGPCCGGLGVEGSNFSPISLASAFTPAFTGRLADARVVVFQTLGFGGDPLFNMSLFSDTGGSPGSLIERLGAGLTAPTAPGGIVTSASVSNPLLMAGTQYWLVLTPFDNNTQIGWETGGSSSVMTDFTLSTTGEGPWTPILPNPTIQFQIDGTVPEPASLLLLTTVLGLAAAVFGTRFNRRTLP